MASIIVLSDCCLRRHKRRRRQQQHRITGRKFPVVPFEEDFLRPIKLRPVVDYIDIARGAPTIIRTLTRVAVLSLATWATSNRKKKKKKRKKFLKERKKFLKKKIIKTINKLNVSIVCFLRQRRTDERRKSKCMQAVVFMTNTSILLSYLEKNDEENGTSSSLDPTSSLVSLEKLAFERSNVSFSCLGSMISACLMDGGVEKGERIKDK